MHPDTLDTPATAGVYLLAFYLAGEHTAYPLVRASHHTGAVHYLGFAHDIRERIEAHRAGRGGKLCRAAIRAGYELRLVRLWAGRGREYERTLKDRHNLGAFCPVCRYRLGSASDTHERDSAGDPFGLWEAWAPSLAASVGPTCTGEAYRHVR